IRSASQRESECSDCGLPSNSKYEGSCPSFCSASKISSRSVFAFFTVFTFLRGLGAGVASSFAAAATGSSFHKSYSSAIFSFAPLRYGEDVAQIRVRRKLGDRNFFPLRLLEVVKLRHCAFHVVDRDVGLPAPPWRVALPQLARQPVQVLQLRHRPPAAITLAPVRARRQPDRKGLGKIFIRMLLRIPSRQMPHIIARERRRPVIVPIRTSERPEGLFPLRRVVQLVRISERVSRFMPQVHHDFSRVFEVMRLFFLLRL